MFSQASLGYRCARHGTPRKRASFLKAFTLRQNPKKLLLKQAPGSRRRMSLGVAPPAEDGQTRDPEELIEDDQELVR